MSFGFSPSDIVTLITLATKTYHGWKHACGEYADITGILDGLCVLLGRIRDEADKPGSILARNGGETEELRDVLRGCRKTVEDLNTVVLKFKSLSSSRKKNWDRLRLGVKNLGELRAKLTQHTSTVTAYLETVGLGSLGRIEDRLTALPTEILQGIDGLAAEIRSGRREGSVMTTYEDDEKDVWRQFRRELVSDGIKSSIIHRYKPLIRQYLRKLAEEGALEEEPLSVGVERFDSPDRQCSTNTASAGVDPIEDHDLSVGADGDPSCAAQSLPSTSRRTQRNIISTRATVQEEEPPSGGPECADGPAPRCPVSWSRNMDEYAENDSLNGREGGEDLHATDSPVASSDRDPSVDAVSETTSKDAIPPCSPNEMENLAYDDIHHGLVTESSLFERIPLHRQEMIQPGRRGYILQWTLPLWPAPGQYRSLPPSHRAYHSRILYAHLEQSDEILKHLCRRAEGGRQAFLSRQIPWLPLREPEDRVDLEVVLPPTWRWSMTPGLRIVFDGDVTCTHRICSPGWGWTRLPDIFDQQVPVPSGWIAETGFDGVVRWVHRKSNLAILRHPAEHPEIEAGPRNDFNHSRIRVNDTKSKLCSLHQAWNEGAVHPGVRSSLFSPAGDCPLTMSLLALFPELSSRTPNRQCVSRDSIKLKWTAELEQANPGMREHLIEWQERMNNIARRYPETKHLVVCRTESERSQREDSLAGPSSWARVIKHRYYGVDHYNISLSASARLVDTFDVKLNDHLYTLSPCRGTEDSHRSHELEGMDKVSQWCFQLFADEVLCKLAYFLSLGPDITPAYTREERAAQWLPPVRAMAFACFFAPKYATSAETEPGDPQSFTQRRNLEPSDGHHIWETVATYIRTLHGSVLYHPGVCGAGGFVLWLELTDASRVGQCKMLECRAYSIQRSSMPRGEKGVVGMTNWLGHVLSYRCTVSGLSLAMTSGYRQGVC